MSAMSTEDHTYNGWANYPTWCVNLWLSNDQGLYNHVSEAIGECAGETRRVDAADWLRDFVRGSIEEDALTPEYQASMASDLLGYALDCVDWFEIADAWLEDVESAQ